MFKVECEMTQLADTRNLEYLSHWLIDNLISFN